MRKQNVSPWDTAAVSLVSNSDANWTLNVDSGLAISFALLGLNLPHLGLEAGEFCLLAVQLVLHSCQLLGPSNDEVNVETEPVDVEFLGVDVLQAGHPLASF